MTEWNQHPFLDPTRQHTYDGPPPVAFANPNDYTYEADWHGDNFALEHALREPMPFRDSAFYGGDDVDECDYDEEDDLCIEEVLYPLDELAKMATRLVAAPTRDAKIICRETLDATAVGEITKALTGMDEEDARLHSELVAYLYSFWPETFSRVIAPQVLFVGWDKTTWQRIDMRAMLLKCCAESNPEFTYDHYRGVRMLARNILLPEFREELSFTHPLHPQITETVIS